MEKIQIIRAFRLVKSWQQWLLICVASLAITACVDHGDMTQKSHEHKTVTSGEVEKGSHNGRLLHDNKVTLELAIFENGLPPEFRAWFFVDGEPLAPEKVNLRVRLVRLGDKTDVINFVPQEDFLRGDSVIYEPHSFIVHIDATINGSNHQWQYDSLEGRTHIEPAVANALEIVTDIAGAAILKETITVYGKVIADPSREREIQARFDGVITAVHTTLGAQINAGQALFTVNSNESLKSYEVVSPIAGVVTNLSAKAGEHTQGRRLVRVLDNSQVAADLAIFPQQLARVKPGAEVTLTYLDQKISSTIDLLALEANSNQSINARITLKQPLPLGSLVSAQINVAEYDVPLAVKRSGLQAFRDFTVVYAQVGDEYEVRMLELGREAGEWVEVLGGLEAGTRYVTENSFVIKADIEKSGASHDH